MHPDKTIMLVGKHMIEYIKDSDKYSILKSENSYQIFDYVINNVRKWEPSVVYYIAAVHQSAIKATLISDKKSEMRTINTINPIKIASALKNEGEKVKFVYFSSALIFSGSTDTPQSEKTVPLAKCDYGKSKIEASELLKNIEKDGSIELYNLILYGHESIYRGKDFFSTPKILF